MRQPKLWNADRIRTYHPQSAHRVVDDILLRYSQFEPGDDFVERVCSEIASINYPAMKALPEAFPIIFGLMAKVCGEHLGRVFISRMAPGIRIPLHSDRIPPAEEAFPNKTPPAVYFERYQLLLHAKPGVVFRADDGATDESVFMASGEIWWFNNCVPHEVINNSDDDRISLVVDIRPFQP